MGKDSKIEWCDHTWNPWVGCTKVSAGCENCYMFRDQTKFGNDPTEIRRTSSSVFELPNNIKEPGKFFVCSWSDFFHEDVPHHWRMNAMDIMHANKQHTFLLLTKRPENIVKTVPGVFFRQSRNVWVGVTAENQEMADKRIPILLNVPAAVRFVSCEPLLGLIIFDQWEDGPYYSRTEKLDWVIVGAESGPNRRPCSIEWIRDIVRQCKEAGIPVFVKQMGINGKISADTDTWPEDLRIQEFPR